MRKVRNQKGFTIMELMIVIVIIGILIAIAVPAYNNFVANAQRRACQSNQRTLESADGLRFAETGTHATSAAELAAYVTNAATIGCSTTGTFTIAGGSVTCSIAAHNTP